MGEYRHNTGKSLCLLRVNLDDSGMGTVTSKNLKTKHPGK
jgi:hypothetical protein